MPLYVIDPAAVLVFRQNHRKEVRKQRSAKRRQRAAKERERQLDRTDANWLNAIERDSKGESGT